MNLMSTYWSKMFEEIARLRYACEKSNTVLFLRDLHPMIKV